MDIFAKFDQQFDTASLAEDVKNAKSGEFKEVPHGDYEVSINKMELVESKSGNPMVTVWFRVVGEGEYKGSMIFMNQVITQHFQICIVNEFLRSLGTNLEVEFKNYKQYSNLIMDIHEAIDGNFEYGLSYEAAKKNGFSTYKITEVFELE